jgi:glycosyltransferase involved in cell wall biosynthesis
VIVGIDAANIRDGGGISYLAGLLRAVDPAEHGISQVVLWGNARTLRMIDDRPWLVKSHQKVLERSLVHRIIWQTFRLSGLARAAGCDMLFIPGGSFVGDFQPIVTISQNLLPFEWNELRRYGWSRAAFKLVLLRMTQCRTFRKAQGLIFLSQYARTVVTKIVGERQEVDSPTIPHGMDVRFSRPPRPQLPISHYTTTHPFRILYVSIIDVYKHQWCVAEAVSRLRAEGLPVTVDFAGPAYPPAQARFQQTVRRIDPQGQMVTYCGRVPYHELPEKYAAADLFVFASSCENLPIILIEAMAAGLPIVASNRGAMPEVLGDAGLLCDPENADALARHMRIMIESPELRAAKAHMAYERAQSYSWVQCARETFGIFSRVVQRTKPCEPPRHHVSSVRGR